MKKYLWLLLFLLMLTGPFMFFVAVPLAFWASEGPYSTWFISGEPYSRLASIAIGLFIFWGFFVAAPVGFLSSVTYIVLLENKNKNWWKVVLVSLLGIANFLTIYPIFWLICHWFG